MSNHALVSIIIPAYNAEKFIAEALESALRQTYRNIEVIVVDDGSTDGTKLAVERFLGDPKVRYIHQENKGLSGARNTGIKNSGGELIALLDADDIYLPGKIGRHVEHFAVNPGLTVSYSGAWHFWDGEPGRLLKFRLNYYSGKDVLSRLLGRYFIAPSTAVIRREAFDRFGYFDENLRRCEDLEFWLRLAYGGAEFIYLPEELVKIRMRHEGSLQGLKSQPAVKSAAVAVLENLDRKMSSEERDRYGMKKALRLHRLKAAMANILVGNKNEAKEFMLAAFADLPLGGILVELFWAPFSIIPAKFMAGAVGYIYLLQRNFKLKKA